MSLLQLRKKKQYETRQEGKIKYPFEAIAFIIIVFRAQNSAVIAASKAAIMPNNLKKLLGYPLDINISHDSILRFIHNVPEEFFLSLGSTINEMLLEFEKLTDRSVSKLSQKLDQFKIQQIAIDGKQVTGRRKVKKPSSTTVSAYGVNSERCIDFEQVGPTGGEKACMKTLLRRFTPKDMKTQTVVTADAVYNYGDVIEVAEELGIPTVINLKDNQPTLFKIAKSIFSKEELDFDTFKIKSRANKERTLTTTDVITNTSENYIGKRWSTVTQLVRTIKVNFNKTKTISTRFYSVTGGVFTAEELATMITGHWYIENKLHGVLDVTIKEDSSCRRREKALNKITILNKILFAIVAEFAPTTHSHKETLEKLSDYAITYRRAG